MLMVSPTTGTSGSNFNHDAAINQTDLNIHDVCHPRRSRRFCEIVRPGLVDDNADAGEFLCVIDDEGNKFQVLQPIWHGQGTGFVWFRGLRTGDE